MPFELTTKTPATLATMTPRLEKHGDKDIPAVSLGLRIKAPNTLLDVLAPGLMAMLYKPVEKPADEPEQGELPEVEAATSMPLLRTRVIETLHLRGELNGWKLGIYYGIDDDSAIHLDACKCDKFRVLELLEGGRIELAFRIGTSDVDEESMGRLTMLLGSEIMVTLIAPVRNAGPVIDGTTDAFRADHPEADLFSEPDPVARDAESVFAEQHGGRDGEAGPGAGDSDEPQWPEPDANGSAADTGAAEFEAGMQKALDDAGVAPKAARRGRRATAGAVE